MELGGGRWGEKSWEVEDCYPHVMAPCNTVLLLIMVSNDNNVSPCFMMTLKACNNDLLIVIWQECSKVQYSTK